MESQNSLDSKMIKNELYIGVNQTNERIVDVGAADVINGYIILKFWRLSSLSLNSGSQYSIQEKTGKYYFLSIKSFIPHKFYITNFSNLKKYL